MMKVQEFIKANGWAALQEDPLNIKVRVYETEKVAVLNYDQVESPKNHPIVVECRSLILSYPEADVISRSFDRFYNLGECPEFYADFDISRAVVATKYDGSLIKVYWSPATNRWEISTRSQAFGEGPHACGGIFRDWVLKAMNLTEAGFQHVMSWTADKEYTYVCEYVGPSNRIVTRYEHEHMVLLAARHNQDGLYLNENHETITNSFSAAGMNIVPAATFPLSSFEDIVKAAEDLPTLEEGFVCWDPISNKRVKIKASSYVAIHHLRDNGVPSAKRIYTLVLVNEQDEYLSYFPEDRKMFEPIVEDVEKFRQSLMALWPEVAGIEDQKEFALKVKDHKGFSFFFTAKKLKVSVIHAFDEAPIEKKIKMFNIKRVIEVSE